jgi:hypothetical protein
MDLTYDHSFIEGLTHIIDSQAGNSHGGQSFHFDAGSIYSSHQAFNFNQISGCQGIYFNLN